MTVREPRPQMTAFRKGKEMTIRQMAKVCKCSPGLLYGIEYEGFITHPHIAARIAAVYKMGLEGYNDLVADERRATELPKPTEPPKETNIDKAWREGWNREWNKGHMNRAQRRAAKSKKVKKPAWHGLTKEQKKEALFRNGITTKDLEREYDTGYKQARRELTSFTMMMFYCATAISAHRLFGFGETRIARLLDDIQQIMTEEIGTEDMIERCKRETGIDIIEDGYDN